MVYMRISIILFLALSLLFSGNELLASELSIDKIDYSVGTSWARFPCNPDKSVDVFYVYPTVFGSKDSNNMDITLSEMREKVESSLLSQIGVYSGVANTYAPYYRQISGALIGDMKTLPETPYYKIAKNDVLDAFDYYIENYNHGKPFILAGHSQGSMLLIDVMKERMSDELAKRLVGAYLIGFSVLQSDIDKYSWMRSAKRSNDTGVIVSYNTQSSTAKGSPVLLKGAICINPLSWRTDSQKVSKEENFGAVFFDSDGKVTKDIPKYCGAYIDLKSGALITQPPEKLYIGIFPDGVYHLYDYTFWYRNLQSNVEERVDAFAAKHE